MSTYAIDNGNSEKVCDGLSSEHDARKVAQDAADRLGEPVYLYETGEAEETNDMEEFLPRHYTPSGELIVAWGSYGSVRGYGPLRRSRKRADADLDRDRRGCVSQGGYSDRVVVAVDADGICYDAEDLSQWVPGPGGRSCGAARYALERVAKLAK